MVALRRARLLLGALIIFAAAVVLPLRLHWLPVPHSKGLGHGHHARLGFGAPEDEDRLHHELLRTHAAAAEPQRSAAALGVEVERRQHVHPPEPGQIDKRARLVMEEDQEHLVGSEEVMGRDAARSANTANTSGQRHDRIRHERGGSTVGEASGEQQRADSSSERSGEKRGNGGGTVTTAAESPLDSSYLQAIQRPGRKSGLSAVSANAHSLPSAVLTRLRKYEEQDTPELGDPLKPVLFARTPAAKQAIARQPVCADFYGVANVSSVAVVGNGPLTRLDRLMIAETDIVIRFNEMTNR